MKLEYNHRKIYMLLFTVVILLIFIITYNLITHNNSYLLVLLTFVILIQIALVFFIYNKYTAAQDEIRYSFGQRSLLLENSLDCVIICDNDGRVKEVNSFAETSFGYAKEEFVGKKLNLLYNNDQEFESIVEHISSKGKYDGEVVNVKKNGEIFISFLYATAIKDEKGKILGSLGISRDISQQKILERNNSFLLNNLNEVIYTVNQKGEFTYLNQATVDIIGYQPEELIGKSYSELLFQEDESKVIAFYEKQFSEGIKNTNYEFRLKTKDGRIIWINQILKAIYQADQKFICGFQGIIKDITTEKEIAQKISNLKDSFNEIADTINDVFYLYNIQEEKYEYISPKCKNILALTLGRYRRPLCHTPFSPSTSSQR